MNEKIEGLFGEIEDDARNAVMLEPRTKAKSESFLQSILKTAQEIQRELEKL